ncbi:MAG: cytochrome c [Myxococcota bacterium]
MRRLGVALALLAASSVGCWEQIDGGKWFPQMKRQAAVQAFERVDHAGQLQGFTPPDGTVPVGGAGVPDLAAMALADQEAIANPVAPSLASLERGKVLFGRYCAACHGPQGAGNGPVAGPPFGTGPLGLVLPIGGATSVARGLTDGHIYTTISLGRGRMPSYRRIGPEDRWNVVNYVRELNGGRP